MLGPDALAWRDRHYGQSSCPQGRRRARENRGNRRNAAAPTPLFSRSQSDRAVLRKTQSSPAQVRRALHPRPLGSNRNNPPDLHSRRVQQLPHTRRIWAKMRGIRSSICECVYLRVAPSARAANSLLLLPPFPPAAERCAFTCVESIICVSVARPFPASPRNRFSHTPRRAQRTKRL